MKLRKGQPQKSMTQLDDILNDGRLARLFAADARHCALQLWILQIKAEQSIENRVVYGRLVPYSHSNGRWLSTDDDNFRPFGQVHAQLVRVNLFLKSTLCAELLRQLSAGRSISAISRDLQLLFPDKLNHRFGTTALTNSELVYRPVAYLLNRDAHDPHMLSSPHGTAGALSASITQIDKGALFRLGEFYNVAFTEAIVNQLNAETGLDFGGADITRLGDLELIVFPALDDMERSLLTLKWVKDPPALVACFDPRQVSHFQNFQFRLSIMNNDQIVHSVIIRAERDTDGIFECRFDLSNQLQAIIDGTEVEIFGGSDPDFRESILCCRWKGTYFREVNFQTHVAGHGVGSVNFDWLEKTTRPSASARAKAALTINHRSLGFTNRIGGRAADPWVTTNRDLVSLFAKLHPQKSDGRFFLRWGQGDGEGRLQFVEWFKALLIKHEQQQVIIFDPYFESAGLGLLLLLGTPNADFIVFTSLSKENSVADTTTDASVKPTPSRVSNLVESCERNRNLIKCRKLRIYGLKEGQLHDRYILFLGQDGLPAGGFTLSNSFQSAAENYPLLVTPIPTDTLLKVEQYKTELIREAEARPSKRKITNSSVKLIFDSAVLPRTRWLYEPLLFLENADSGDVLSMWTNEPALQGLSGARLKDRLISLGWLRDGSLALPEMGGLRNFLKHQSDFSALSATWNVLGDLLAHSNINGDRFAGLEHEHDFLGSLALFLLKSFDRPYDNVDEEVAVMDVRFFREPVETLLHSSYVPGHFSGNIKYQVLSWAECFAIKLLWSYAPERLCEIIETKMAVAPIDPQGPDVVRLSLLGQALSEVSFSVTVSISELQEDVLLHSSSGLLQWMGLNALERKLEKPDGFSIVLRKLAAFSRNEQIRNLGWMIYRAAKSPKTTYVYKNLITSLIRVLPKRISIEELRHLVDSMRGHMRHLAWAEPWLFRDIIYPLLQDKRAEIDHACEIWIQELVVSLGPGYEHQYKLFDRTREGQTTNIAAFLLAQSSVDRQKVSLQFVREILRRQRRFVLQPLASTSNWTRWNEALVVSMWVLAFTRWSQFYIRKQGGETSSELGELERDANELAIFRPLNEWQSVIKGTQSELTAFLDQVDELLASKRNSKSNKV